MYSSPFSGTPHPLFLVPLLFSYYSSEAVKCLRAPLVEKRLDRTIAFRLRPERDNLGAELLCGVFRPSFGDDHRSGIRAVSQNHALIELGVRPRLGGGQQSGCMVPPDPAPSAAVEVWSVPPEAIGAPSIAAGRGCELPIRRFPSPVLPARA